MFIDTHCHLSKEDYDDLDLVIKDNIAAGVGKIIISGCSKGSIDESLDLASKYDNVFLTLGYHPSEVDYVTDELLIDLKSKLSNKKVVGLGEIGLDYHYDFSPREKQKEVFAAQLELANELDLPVIIHDREAHADTLELVKKYRPKGIIHCFSGSAETAKEFLKLGMYLGFTGSVTFKNASKLLLAAQVVPEDRILLETDCPYMAPVPYRGQRCDSSLIPATAERLAEIRGTDAQTLIDRARENGMRIYGINAED